jgi:hypothetical protein
MTTPSPKWKWAKKERVNDHPALLVKAQGNADFFVRDARVVWRIEVALVVFSAPFYRGLQEPFWQVVPCPAQRMARPDTWAVSPSFWANAGSEAWSLVSISGNVAEWNVNREV